MKTITPRVNETQEFIEIAFDFANALDLVREAISNSFDANAKTIKMNFDKITESGEVLFRITLEDDGNGMNEEGLQSFFDLGNSLSRGDEDKIGEKGHGTKIYFNCRRIVVETAQNGTFYKATMEKPKTKLFNREIPTVEVEETEIDKDEHFTKITILGYNDNDNGIFTHDRIKDYILWFTKMGSIEKEFDINDNKDVVLYLKGFDKQENKDEYEKIEFGHIFPKESVSASKLLDEYLVKAPDFYCKRFTEKGTLESDPGIEYEAVFYVEGTKVKYGYNDMVRRPGYTAPRGAYTVQERYGLWLCKDYMPIQRKNEWITKKGTEFTRFHAFINCQELKLTANRGSVENTSAKIIDDLEKIANKMYDRIVESSDWADIKWLETEKDAYNTVEKEKKDYSRRVDLIKSSRVADYKGIRLVEPQLEQGVFCLYLQLSQLSQLAQNEENEEDKELKKLKELFPFIVLDYDTHSGIDVLVKDNAPNVPINNSKIYYVEFKNYLESEFNHSFENVHSIVCWDLSIKHGDKVRDIGQKVRKLSIVSPSSEDDYTKYFLDDPNSSFKIEVFVLKTYLKDKLGIEFRQRTADDCY